MSHIYPLEGQKHFDLRQELIDLGGTEKKNFRLAFAWDGEHFMEITDDTDGADLYTKWIELHGGTGEDSKEHPKDEGSSGSGSPGAQADGTDVAEQTNANKADPDSIGDSVSAAGNEEPAPVGAKNRSSTEKTVAEPPEQSSDEDEPAATETQAETAEESDTEDPITGEKAASRASGTTRKRSAKNSTRRS